MNALGGVGLVEPDPDAVAEGLANVGNCCVNKEDVEGGPRAPDRVLPPVLGVRRRVVVSKADTGACTWCGEGGFEDEKGVGGKEERGVDGAVEGERDCEFGDE